MTSLTMGANAPLSGNTITLTLTLQGGPADITALQLYNNNKVRGDGDMCFFNQPSISNGAVALQSSGQKHTLSLSLDKLNSDVEKIVVFGTVDNGTFSKVSSLSFQTSQGHALDIPTQGRTEAALIFCEIYKRNGQWKIKNIGQGFNGGLAAIATHFGVDIAEPEPTPKPTPQPTPAPTPTAAPKPTSSPVPAANPINLKKITLTKEENSISLKKDNGKFGLIKVNLNWNQRSEKRGLFGLGRTGIDLDLGAFVELKLGRKTAVQALGNTFGAYHDSPYVFLKGDDRSGQVADGEWLDINGDMWSEIKRVLIYAFIYEGAANWKDTDGIVRVMVPGQPEIEVRMNEVAGSENLPMCAVALLENVNGTIKVSREVKFFHGHQYMDHGYDWGLRWQAGRK